MMGKLISSILITASLAGIVAVALPTPVSAACGRLLTFPTWYNGLTDGNCELKEIGEDSGQVEIKTFVVRIIMNIIEMILQLVGYATLVMLIVGGFHYIVSAGDSSSMANSKKTILNSIIGLVISIFSVAIVNVVSGVFYASSNSANIGNTQVEIPKVEANSAVLLNALNTIYTWAGIIAVLVIVIAGYFFTLSRGESNQIARARNAIIAASIGLIVVLFAFTITQFILGSVG